MSLLKETMVETNLNRFHQIKTFMNVILFIYKSFICSILVMIVPALICFMISPYILEGYILRKIFYRRYHCDFYVTIHCDCYDSFPYSKEESSKKESERFLFGHKIFTNIYVLYLHCCDLFITSHYSLQTLKRRNYCQLKLLIRF
jgi:hypothetical protein